MSNDQPRRATLSFGDDESSVVAVPPPAPPSVPPEKIREATRAAGFHETPRRTEAAVAVTPAPASPEPLINMRRARRKTGRVHPFATRLREGTLNQIHAYADEHEISLAEVIEMAMDRLSPAKEP
jgi:hypothetical protein